MMHAPGVEITDGAIYLLAAVMQQGDARLHFDVTAQDDAGASGDHIDPRFDMVEDSFAADLTLADADVSGALSAENSMSTTDSAQDETSTGSQDATTYFDHLAGEDVTPTQFIHSIQGGSPAAVEVAIFGDVGGGLSYGFEGEVFL